MASVWLPMASFFTYFSVPYDPQSERTRRIIFQYYQLIIAVLFFIGGVIDLLVDFKNAPLWVFITLATAALSLMYLSRLGTSIRTLMTINMLFILFINEIQILNSPTSFHVIVYWIGFVPLLVAALTTFRETLFWTIVLMAFIFVNGKYVQSLHPVYHITVDPDRFMTAGFLYTLMTSTIAAFFSYTQGINRKKLLAQNTELKVLTKEIENQNRVLKNQNEEISSINNQLGESNQHLEDRVRERTWELEEQNKKLAEYAFINSHLLRGPLARILGLVHMLSSTPLSKHETEIVEHLKTASHDLDEVVIKINKALDGGNKITRESIRKLKEKKGP
ncbi:MAG: hypothetical protein ACOYXT_04435 [Bacteroidota bacterium]